MNLPLNIDLRQILLHMLNFVLLFGGLYFILYKPVKDFMDKREQEYKDRETEIESNEKKADEMKALYEQKMADAENEIAEKRSAAENELRTETAQIRKKAQENAQEILDKSRADAERERDEMLRSANSRISELAVSAADKLVFKSTEQAYDEFLNLAEGEKGEGND